MLVAEEKLSLNTNYEQKKDSYKPCFGRHFGSAMLNYLTVYPLSTL